MRALGRSAVRRILLVATIATTAVVSAAGCGPLPFQPAPSSQDAGVSASPSGDATPGVPNYPTATPEIAGGPVDYSNLVPPLFETGDIPPVEAVPGAVTIAAQLGAPVPLASGSADALGGTIVVAKPGDPLDGLAITVPAGAYAGSVPFSISERPLSTTALTEGVTALSPVVAIDNDDVTTTTSRVLVRIPAQIPSDAAGSLVGAYIHDDGTLDLLPVIASDASSATVAAAHFSAIVLVRLDWTRFGVMADSGFRPDVDDWQFRNYGSYVAPLGHCEGQSLTALWYYTTQRAAGASGLYGRYDNNGANPRTPDFWQDDADGYRFASAVQASGTANVPAFDTAWKAHRDYGDRYTFAMFRAAMALSGRPQQVIMWTADLLHAHAMVVYRVGQQQLFVADPNWPGHYRTIRFDDSTGRFDPYYGGDNAGDIAAGEWYEYTKFVFQPVAGRRTDASMAAEWAKFANNAAGDGVFPAARLEYATGEVDANGDDLWADLGPSLTTDLATLRVNINPADPMAALAYRVISYGGSRQQQWSQNTDVDVNLAEGPNDVGIEIQGQVGGDWKYVDFIRIAVERTPAASPSPSPSSAAGSGRWVLTDSWPEAMFPTSYSNNGESLSVASSNGTYSESITSPAYGYDDSGSVAWGQPPASAAEGDTWTSSTTAEFGCSGRLQDAHMRASWHVFYNGATQDPPALTGESEVTATCSSAASPATFTVVFPGDPGGSLRPTLHFTIGWAGHSSGGYQYVYTWQP